jgi:glycosyltransferase involved in cell wall biosynthesis
MLRVLTLSTVYPHALEPNFGIFVEGQTCRLAARPGVDLRVVAPLGWPLWPLHVHPRYRRLRALPAAEEWRGVRVWRPRFTTLPGLSGPLNPIALARAVHPVLAQLRAGGFVPDVIDAEFFYPDGPAAARLSSDIGVPFSIKARGADIHYWGARPACRAQILAAAAQAGGLLAVAGSLREDMIALGMDGGKISIHYTGVDLDRFRPRDRGAAKAALGVAGKLVVSLGALIPRKGHDIVVAAMTMLPEATLLIIGAGPEREALARQIHQAGLGERVRLLGSQPHERLPEILAAADVMALASASEGLANAWIEAMACGTPVVAPAVDGATEAIAPPVGGRLVSARTAGAIAAAIRDIFTDAPPPGAVRANAERFTWTRNTDLLLAHLQAIANAPGTAAV